jgi:hypothetical protein
MSVPICVLCKINLTNIDEHIFSCPNCKRQYILDYEIFAYDDEVGTAFDEEAATIEMEGIAAMSGPRLETQPNELDFSNEIKEKDEDPKSKSDIKIPKYLKDSETTKVIDYQEE